MVRSPVLICRRHERAPDHVPHLHDTNAAREGSRGAHVRPARVDSTRGAELFSKRRAIAGHDGFFGDYFVDSSPRSI